VANPPGATARVIGRERELDAVIDFLESMSDGPALFLLEGEAGIGKTLLLQQAIDQAKHRSYRVLTSRPVESETKLSYAALGDLLEPIVEQALPSLSAPQRRALEVALLREEATGSLPDRRAVLLGALEVLRQAAASEPVFLAVDDLHWLDPPSAYALDFMIRRLAPEHVRVLATVRVGSDRAAVPLQRALSEDNLTRLEVGPLEPAALDQIIRARYGSSFPRGTLRELHGASGGNPFVALEMARVLLLRGGRHAPGEPLRAPTSLDDLLHGRLAQLGPATQDLLMILSAVAQPSSSMLRSVIGPGLVEEAMAEAVEAELVEAWRPRSIGPPVAGLGRLLERSGGGPPCAAPSPGGGCTRSGGTRPPSCPGRPGSR